MTVYNGNAWQERQLEMMREDPRRYGCATREQHVVEAEARRQVFVIQNDPTLSEGEKAARAAAVMREAKRPQLAEKTPEQDWQDHMADERAFMLKLAEENPDLFDKYTESERAASKQQMRKLEAKLKPSEAEQKARALGAKLATYEDTQQIQQQIAKEQLAKAELERKAEQLGYEILQQEKDK
ncbi:hypothetical protein [Thioalkalivibrio sp. ALMg3]|uniref:hypothetical protein n=1 Tax=Thioalkalivibrio sp. ALMg3 TaxID=1158163 RepID=UPI000365A278|nr:hypothetical protein [Thioalkalivibrio sp. ALMg3]